MALCIKKGAAIVALFSAFNASADWFEDLARTPKDQIHKPPTFLDHLATKPRVYDQRDSFVFNPPQASSHIGKLTITKEKRACRNQYGEWAFCDL